MVDNVWGKGIRKHIQPAINEERLSFILENYLAYPSNDQRKLDFTEYLLCHGTTNILWKNES